jgi:enamine deaminase RidA (YjgF/YER057c/UK114 family)
VIGEISPQPGRVLASARRSARLGPDQQGTTIMTIRRIETGPRMSQAVIHQGIAHLAGQVGRGANVTEQTRAVLAEIDRLLALAGTDRTRLLTAQIWLADIAKFQEMNAVWDAWVPKGHAPARWTGEARLATPEYLVEIIVTAAV